MWRSKRVVKKTAEVHRIFLKEESRAQIKKVKLSCLLSCFDDTFSVCCSRLQGHRHIRGRLWCS